MRRFSYAYQFLTTALLIVSVITNLTVEGIKKLLDGTKVKYSSNVLAAVLSVLIACAVSVIYLIMTDTIFTMKIGVEIVVLMYLGFLISTVGYDKVIQMLKQIQSVKEETKMSNSPLVSYTKLSPNHSGQRTHVVDRITPHCVVGQCSVETLGNILLRLPDRLLVSMVSAWMVEWVCMWKKRTVPGVLPLMQMTSVQSQSSVPAMPHILMHSTILYMRN